MQNDRSPSGGEWESSEEEVVAWLDEALTRYRQEIDCISDHWDAAKLAWTTGDEPEYNTHLYNIAHHCENLDTATQAIWHIFVERFCRPEVIMQLSREKMEQIVGEPVEIVAQVGDGTDFTGFLLKRTGFDVPDDLSWLDEEGGSGE